MTLPSKLTPTAPQRVHLFLAALAWTVVGALLLAFGARWCGAADWSAAEHPGLLPLLLGAALLAGGLKAVFILNRAADRVIARIAARGDGTCVGGFYSWRTWLFVLIMMVAGRGLRASGVPLEYVGLLYVAVGFALILGSWRTWRAWFALSRPGP